MAYDPTQPLPKDQEGLLTAILQTLLGMQTLMPLPDPVTKRGRVDTVTNGALPPNQSVNVAQIAGVAPLMGAGATAAGAQRIVPANDTLAGVPNVVEVQRQWSLAGLVPLYQYIKVT